ncbi:ribosome-inactivating family protein, partial [Spiroplasma phoeniceum]|uniref:ribosome-inactivating family protein n=1 Tax=Spiroplasma phoeniceum TaxID=47835 RepID=UPI003364C65D
GIDDPIKIIQEYPDNNNYPNNFCSVHVITTKGEIYYIRGGDEVVFKQNDVPYPVTTMYTFTSDRGNRKTGDIYFGTTKGIYLRQAGSSTTTKIDGINGFIAVITPHTNEYNDTHIIKIVSDSETTELVRRQNNNYRLVINNDDDDWKAVISNILNNNYEYYGNSQSERNIRVTSRGFNDYRQSFANIITNLFLTNNNNNFVRNNDQNWWTINPQIGHFIIEVSFTQSSSTSNRLELVFSRQNLYLTGFIIRNQNGNSNYYYFSDANVREINNVDNNISLGFGGSYGELIKNDLDISWENIRDSFISLRNYNHNSRKESALRRDLASIILVTSEAMRFGDRIFSRIGETTQFFNTNNHKKGEFFSWNEEYKKIVNNWGTISDLARNREMNRPSNTNENDWDIFLLAIVYLTIAKNPTNRQ